MLVYQVVSLLLDVLVGLFAGACLLRLYMQYQRIPFRNQIGATLFALSNWAILPLRKVVPAWGRWDSASLFAALAAAFAKTAILSLLSGRSGLSVAVLFGGLITLAQLAVSTTMMLLVISAVLSWVRSDSPIGHTLWMLSEPVLRPLRRVLPPAGNLDWAPLVALLMLQVVSIILSHLFSAVA